MDQKRERSRQRNTLLLVATLCLPDGTQQEFKVRNLSATGLMGETNDPPNCGDSVSVEVGQLSSIAGTVIWQRQKRFGLKFDTEVDPAAAYRPIGGSPKRYESPAPETRKRPL